MHSWREQLRLGHPEPGRVPVSRRPHSSVFPQKPRFTRVSVNHPGEDYSAAVTGAPAAPIMGDAIDREMRGIRADPLANTG